MDDVAELVVGRARPVERAAQLAVRRDRGHDGAEADAERREALEAGRAHREVLELLERLDAHGPRCEAVALRERLARLGVERHEVGRQDRVRLRAPREGVRSVLALDVVGRQALQHQDHVVAPRVLPPAGDVPGAAQGVERRALVAGVRQGAAELRPGDVVLRVALDGPLQEGAALLEAVELAERASELALGRRVPRVDPLQLGEGRARLVAAVLDPEQRRLQRAHVTAARRALEQPLEALSRHDQPPVLEVRRATGHEAGDRARLDGQELVEDLVRRPALPPPVQPVQSEQPEQRALVARRELERALVQLGRRAAARARRVDLRVGLDVQVGERDEHVGLLALALAGEAVGEHQRLRGLFEPAEAPLAGGARQSGAPVRRLGVRAGAQGLARLVPPPELEQRGRAAPLHVGSSRVRGGQALERGQALCGSAQQQLEVGEHGRGGAQRERRAGVAQGALRRSPGGRVVALDDAAARQQRAGLGVGGLAVLFVEERRHRAQRRAQLAAPQQPVGLAALGRDQRLELVVGVLGESRRGRRRARPLRQRARGRRANREGGKDDQGPESGAVCVGDHGSAPRAGPSFLSDGRAGDPSRKIAPTRALLYPGEP